METQASAREFNQAFLAAVSDPRTEKQGADMGSKFIRWRQREEGFVRKFLPPTEVQDSDISRSEWTDKPRVIRDMESDAPAAISVGYGGLPDEVFITPRRFAITGTMILSPRVSVFKQQLRTYAHDVRKVWADNIVKDTMTEEDIHGISTINAGLLGAETNMWATGIPQWRTIAGGISRTSIVEGNKTLVRTPNALPPESALCTVPTLMDFMKWGRDEAGGDIAEQQLRNGWVQMRMFGINWYGTIKYFLVPHGTVYYFTATKALGESLLFDPMQMYVEQKYQRYSFFTTHEIGTVWANTAGFGRVDYTP
jgi:hypothetical protein